MHGPVGQGDEIVDAVLVTMTLVETHGHETRYRGAHLRGRRPLRLHVRVLPSHPDLAQPVEMGKVAWA